MEIKNKQYYRKLAWLIDVEKKLAKAMKERNMLDARVDPVEYWEINGVVEKLEIESQQIDKSLKEWK
tara:strand:- start:13208 stop:13408 length:201 start_codon:yes stop_codon:yes gene_type:complete